MTNNNLHSTRMRQSSIPNTTYPAGGMAVCSCLFHRKTGRRPALYCE